LVLSAPLNRLAPILNKDERRRSAHFNITLPEEPKVIGIDEFTARTRGNVALDESAATVFEVSRIKVSTWPGKNPIPVRSIQLGPTFQVTEQDINTMLYTGSRLELGWQTIYNYPAARPRYHINPHTAELAKSGELIRQGWTVWDELVKTYIPELKFGSTTEAMTARPALMRLAAFDIWARKLGLEPSEEYLNALRKKGLEY
jgi:hypothetical protein